MNELLTVMEMAEFLRISRSKAYNIVKQENFPKIKIDKSIKYSRVETDPAFWECLQSGEG